MASLIYNSALDDMARGLIDFEHNDIRVILVRGTYEPDKDAHQKRSDVEADEVTGAGYTAGGIHATCSVEKDTDFDRVNISLGEAAWPVATITAAGAVYYKANGGASNADELVAYIDFEGDVVSTIGRFSLTASTLRIQN